jgi:Xaa-Pro dipeptidase
MDRYSNRLDKLRETVGRAGLDGVVLVPGPNLRYYTGVNSFLLERPFLMAVPVHGDPHLVAPTLESGPYLRSPLRIAIHSWNDGEGPSNATGEMVGQLRLNGRWGLEGKVPYSFVHLLLKFAQPQFENADPILQGIRSVKDIDEVKLLKRSASILCKAFLKIPDIITAGMSELEVAQRFANAVYSNGAESAPDILVQSGPMAADPHHLPSTRKLRRKESIVVDASCTFEGYFSDITRTFMIGTKPGFVELYESVLQAQLSAISASCAGVTVGSIDNAARRSLQEKALDSYFVHRTGHGLGLEVHEAPYIVPNGAEIIQGSMAFTIEPGVYMQGKIGVRIEDDVMATSHGNKVLTRSLPKEFGWWK